MRCFAGSAEAVGKPLEMEVARLAVAQMRRNGGSDL